MFKAPLHASVTIAAMVVVLILGLVLGLVLGNTAPGQTTGEGFGGIQHVVTPSLT